MSNPPLRVLIVDDSAFARKVLREVLSAEPRIQVVGIARDGLEALEKIVELRPDVVTLDLVMPNLDGLGVLRAMPVPAPKVVIVSISDANSDLGIQALQSGAINLVHKPTALATERLYELGGEIVQAVLQAAEVNTPAYSSASAPPPPRDPAARALPREPARPLRTDLVVIGTSTGGPQALTRVLTALPADFPVPIAIVLHIPVGYTEPMARRLHSACAIEVREASDGLALRPGLAMLAHAGEHLEVMKIGTRGIVRVGRAQDAEPHRPSVDVLFRSAAAHYGARTLGLVLTGMGSDGLRGSLDIVEAGGRVLTEAESSCIVYGMPRCVREANASAGEARLEEIPALLQRSL